MNRQWAGLELDPVEAYEALEPVDSVILGDAATCLGKLERYAEAGVGNREQQGYQGICPVR